MAITYESGAVTLKTNEQMLGAVQDAIDAILTTGASYTLFGSRQVTRADLGQLRDLYDYYEERVLMDKGATGINLADLSGAGRFNTPPKG